ncbi:hypothetical protein KO317_02865 [Candidatus Micrarchaeota archaeon]|jgi:hypothetical protein|nr:hypothetical protein [Candidatus Micrarchaeota archaeon]
MYTQFILEKTKKIKQAFKNKNVNLLKKVQYECIEHLAIEFNNTVYTLAVLCYMLSKMTSKPRYWQNKGIINYLKKIENSLDNVIQNYQNEEKITKALQDIIKTIHTLDIHDKKYVYNLIEGAKIKIGSSLYAKGMTLGVASDLSGADRIEIMQYVGKTTIYENMKEPIEIKERIERVRKIFG